ncbi:uncharacterized protein CEXT_16161 [Caerostris extrusa]|uniref:Uncharacterized protein n=1 Tax=Caerostris extrusa TaxID=172846 RepID=A0AAV4VCA3_CAEEX|nr:uncharacterized protein CEXT_16161 [Caerostris extrusa]
MEEMFTGEAKELGAKYVIKEINDFNELLSEQKTSDFLILDCTGRNSKLRSRMLGSDENNIVSEPLQHAMYINFKAIITTVTSLYQVMKNVPGIKLTEVVVSKNKDSDGFTNVTIPVFITKALAKHFDKEHPDINRNPLNPFNSSFAVSDKIFFPISSIIDINGKSIFKISEVLRAVGGKQSLYRQDFNFLLKCFKARREVVIYNTCSEIKEITVVFIIYNLVNQLGENITNVLHKVKRICTNEKFSNEEKIRLIKFTISNTFEKNSKELVLETAEKAIGLWPKLLGLRFDGNEVRLNIVLTLIKNELRACYRNCSQSTSIMGSTSNHEDSSESSNQNKLSIAVSEENLLLDDWVLVDSMQTIRESRRYRSQTNLTRVCKSIECAPIYNPTSEIWELKNKIKCKK